MYVLLHVCSSLVHSSRQPAVHFCPPASWWPSGAPQSSAGTSWCHAPPPPVEQGGEERRRKTKSKKGEYMQAGRQVMEVDGKEEVVGWGWDAISQCKIEPVCAVHTGYPRASHECMSCRCGCMFSLSLGKNKQCTPTLKVSPSFKKMKRWGGSYFSVALLTFSLYLMMATFTEIKTTD